MTDYTLSFTVTYTNDNDARRFRSEVERALQTWMHRPEVKIQVTRGDFGSRVDLDWTDEQIRAADDVIKILQNYRHNGAS